MWSTDSQAGTFVLAVLTDGGCHLGEEAVGSRSALLGGQVAGVPSHADTRSSTRSNVRSSVVRASSGSGASPAR